MESSVNYFTELYRVNVAGHVEKKNGFSYVSWPFAVAELKKRHPDATWEVIKHEGLPFVRSECGTFVEVAVTVNGITHSQIHPVLDHANKPLQQPNAFQINTSIQRCLVKAIALHGLGLFVYAGEDLPEEDTDAINAIVEEIKDLYAKDDHAGMYGVWEAITDNEVRLRVWSFLQPDSKIRSAIKAYKNKLEESK